MEKKEKTYSPTKILAKALYGKIRLEHHPQKGFIVMFLVVRFPFWVTWEKFSKIHNKFAEIVKIKTAKKNFQ